MAYHTVGELRARHLTGRVRGRPGWFGRVVMQVEIRSPVARGMKPPPPPGSPPRDVWAQGSYTFWRDANRHDLTEGACTARGGSVDACP